MSLKHNYKGVNVSSDGQTDGWMDILTDIWKGGWMDGWTDKQTNGWTDVRTDTDRRMDIQTGGWTDCKHQARNVSPTRHHCHPVRARCRYRLPECW